MACVAVAVSTLSTLVRQLEEDQGFVNYCEGLMGSRLTRHC